MAYPQRPVASIDSLRDYYVGRDVLDVPRPAAVIDRAVMRRHCMSLLKAVADLDVGFRAHVKSHKVSPPGDAPTQADVEIPRPWKECVFK